MIRFPTTHSSIAVWSSLCVYDETTVLDLTQILFVPFTWPRNVLTLLTYCLDSVPCVVDVWPTSMCPMFYVKMLSYSRCSRFLAHIGHQRVCVRRLSVVIPPTASNIYTFCANQFVNRWCKRIHHWQHDYLERRDIVSQTDDRNTTTFFKLTFNFYKNTYITTLFVLYHLNHLLDN